MMRGIIIHDNIGDNVVMTIVGILYLAINKDRETSAFRNSHAISQHRDLDRFVANFFQNRRFKVSLCFASIIFLFARLSITM